MKAPSLNTTELKPPALPQLFAAGQQADRYVGWGGPNKGRFKAIKGQSSLLKLKKYFSDYL